MDLRRDLMVPRVLFLRIACVAVFALCAERLPHAQGPQRPPSSGIGFEASISGAYEGKVRGPGVLQLLPNAGFKKQGYFFLSDSQGIRPFGVTFILPRGLGPGKHTLRNPSSLEIGTVPSVRVDRDMGNSVVSADRNTLGFLNLSVFPNKEGNLIGSDVRGSFEFETEGKRGERISVKGRFSFVVK